MIELRHLRYFLALAEHLHYGKAAAAVHVAQPSLSRQIADLEQQLGCQLVSRTSRSVALTAAGHEFQRNAAQVLQGLDATVRATQAVARGERGELKIAFTSMMAWTGLPRIIKTYTRSAPEVALVMSELLPAHMPDAVISGECDIGLGFRSLVREPLQYRHLQTETLCMALPLEHPLAARARIDLSDLKDEPFILSPRTTATVLFDAIHALCQRHGFEPQVRLYTQLQGTIVNLVGEGLGVSVVPAAMAGSNTSNVRYVPVEDSPGVELGMIWNAESTNPCLLSFLASIGADGV